MVDLVNGLGGPRGFGENVVGRNDDASTEAIDITSVFDGPLNFFGEQQESVFLNNNGSITFEQPRSQFTPDTITADSGNPEITPYFADVDTGGPLSEQGSEEPADLTPTPSGNSTGSNLVYYDLDQENNTFTATWDDVGYFSQNTDKLNAFQLQLIGQGDGNFDIVFRYEDLNWTTGGASGGQNGLGGEVARAGFTAGDGENFFELPQSGDQGSMLNLNDTTGNTGQEGVYRFEVRSGETDIIPTLTTSNLTIEEGDSGTTDATFSVGLNQSIDREVTVDYTTRNGTATAGEGYESQSGTLTFEPGETEQTINVPVIGDEQIEPNEDVVLELSNPSNAEFTFGGNTFSRRLTIQDDDGPIVNSEARGNNWGDPHLVTLDGADYDFQTVGEFILTESENNDFQVQVRQQPLEGSNNVSINTAVATQLNGENVGIYATREQPLVIGDTPTELQDGESVTVGNGEVFRNGDRYTIVNPGQDGQVNDGDSQVVATVRGDRIDLEVYVAESQQGNLSGLLGNFNDNPNDDFALRDGTQLEQPVPFEQLVNEFADSWRISQDESLFSYQGDDTTETFTDGDFPNRPISVEDLTEQEREEAEQAVDDAGITAPNLRNAAILDVALSGDESFIESASQAQVSLQNADTTTDEEQPDDGDGQEQPDDGDGQEQPDDGDTPGDGAGGGSQQPSNQPPSIDHIDIDRTVSATGQIQLGTDIFAEVFSDPEGSELSSIVIESLPDNGVLKLNDEPVSAGDTISANELSSLVVEPDPGFTGTLEFRWNASDGERLSLFDKTTSINVQAAEDEEPTDDEDTGDGVADGGDEDTGDGVADGGDEDTGDGVADGGDEDTGDDGIADGGDEDTDDEEGEQADNEIIGSDSDDILEGTVGNDDVSAGGGNDLVVTFSGNDNLRGDAGDDIMNGNQGDDNVDGDDGNDILFGGQGNDNLQGSNGEDILNGNLGNDVISGGNDADVIFSGPGNDNANGDDGDDIVFGNQGEDVLNGNNGNDTILGGQQADIISGGNGDDFLSGDLQEDTLTGGEGSDRFLLRNVSGADIITDFEDGIDSLVLPTSDFPVQPNGLTFEDLNITQAEGGTVISVDGNTMAGLTGVDASNITEEDFQNVSSL